MNPTRTGRRRGFGLIELTIATILLAAAMVITVQVVGWVAVDRRAVERRERAVAEASNLLERLSARPWGELDSDAMSKLRLSEAAGRFLPGGLLNVQVATAEGPPPRKKLTVEIRWRDRSGRTEAPVRIVAWVHRRGDMPR